MSMAPKDWNTQEEAIAAAKTEILAAIGDTDARLELGMIKSIQHGYSCNIKLGTTLDIVISSVNPDKSVILFETFGGTYGYGVYVKSFTTEKITISTQGYTGNTDIYFSWQLVEFY